MNASFENAEPYISENLDMVFRLDPAAFSPRKLVYAEAVRFAETYGFRIPSAPEVYTALRARRFRETKRRGVHGFIGIDTSHLDPDLPRVKPAGTASSYDHRGDRSERARSAVYMAKAFRRLEKQVPDTASTDLSPWAVELWSPMDRAMMAAARRHYPRPRAENAGRTFPSIDD